ncbi:MAG TPA: hypothetical protein VIR33_07335 [Thermopolyspora sp.]|jgi:hypothetical protein
MTFNLPGARAFAIAGAGVLAGSLVAGSGLVSANGTPTGWMIAGKSISGTAWVICV